MNSTKITHCVDVVIGAYQNAQRQAISSSGIANQYDELLKIAARSKDPTSKVSWLDTWNKLPANERAKLAAAATIQTQSNQGATKETSSNLGASAGIGVALGGFVGSSLPAVNFGNQAYFGNGKGVTQRVSEIGIGVGASYIINNYVLKNTGFRDSYINQIGVIVAADLAGEYISDYVAGRPLAIFE